MLQVDTGELKAGVMVYRDHDPDAYSVFYFLPQQPRYRLNPDGKPSFGFYKYRFPVDHPDGRKGGGFLLFDVEFVLDPTKESLLKSELAALVAKEANRRGEHAPAVELRSPTYVKGETKLYLAGSDGTFVEKLNNPGKPSLFGSNVTTLALELTPEGATFFEQAMQGAGGSVSIVYDLWFYGQLPKVNITATFNATKFYSFYQTVDQDWFFWFNDSYRETVREAMIQAEAIKVVADWGALTDPKAQTELRDWALRSLEDAVERNMIEAVTPITDDQRKVPDGIEDITRDISSIKISNITRNYNESRPVEWNAAPQGVLQNITALKDANGDPLKWSDYAREIDLNDAFFQQLRVNTMVNADFAKLPIHSVEVKLTYKGRPMANLAPGEPEGEVVLVDAQKIGKFAAFVEGDDWKYKYSYQVNYRGQSRIYQSPEIETNEGNLTIGVDDVGVLAVDVSAGDLNWSELERAMVMLKYADEANGVAPIEEQFQLTQASPTYRVQHVIFQPMRNNYSYRVKYFMKGGKEYEGSEVQGRSKSLFINDVFGGRKTISVRGAGDFAARLQSVFVDLEYVDTKNGYSQKKTQALTSASPFFDWTFPVISEGEGAVTYEATVVNKDGTSSRVPKTSMTSDTLLLPPATEAFLDVQVIADLVDWQLVRLGRVSLSYEDPENEIAQSNDFIFSADKSDPASWRVELKNRERDSFRYLVTYYMVDGLRRNIGPVESEDRSLVLETPL